MWDINHIMITNHMPYACIFGHNLILALHDVTDDQLQDINKL